VNAIELQRAKTHCPKGHAYDLLNTCWTRSGHRRCRTCEQARGHRRYADQSSRNYWKARTKEQRQAERARIAVRKGKRYRRREEIVPVVRHPKMVRVRWSLEAHCLVLLLRDEGDAGLSVDSLGWRARYRYDADFREREVARTQARKYGRSVRVVEASDGTLTPGVMQRLFAEARHCPYCGEDMASNDKTLDHVWPLSLGGAHSITNVLVCCNRCNSRKCDLLPDEWARRVGAA
jgi:5-methylcytosine-specific restriction endonuclease McrA